MEIHSSSKTALRNHPNPDTSNPNLIDLSRPLDAADVERILQALQLQQQRQPVEGGELFDDYVDDAAFAASQPAIADFGSSDITKFNDAGAGVTWEQLRLWALVGMGSTGL